MFKSFKLSDFWLNVTKLTVGSIFSQFFVILLTPILTRIYSPEDYGILGVVNSIAGFIIVVSAFRLERAIVLVKVKNANKLLNICITISFLISSFLFLIIYSFKYYLLNLFELPSVEYLLIIPIIILLNGILNSIKSYGNSMQFYNFLTYGIIINSILSILLKLILGYSKEPNAILLLISEISAVLITILFLKIAFKSKINSFKYKIPKLFYAKKIILDQKDFLKYDIIGSLLNNASWMAPILILSYFFDKTIVGYYTLGFTMLRLPMNLLGKAIGEVFYKNASDYTDLEQISKSVKNVISKLFGFGFIPIVFIALFGNHLFSIIFGQQWEQAGVYSQILSFWSLIWFISSPISNLYYVLKIQNKLLNFTGISLILRIFSLVIGGFLNNPTLTILLFSIVSFALYLYQLVYLSFKVKVIPSELFKVVFKEVRFLKIPLMLMLVLFYLDFSLYVLIIASFVLLVTLLYKLLREINKRKKYA